MPLFIRLRYFKKSVADATGMINNNGKLKRPDPAMILTGDIRLEYISIRKLIKIIFVYYGLCMVLGFISLMIYFEASTSGRQILEARSINSFWFSAFHAISSFNNAGFTLLSENLVPFNASVPLLLITSFLILLGNTAFPIVLYVIVWILSRIKKQCEVYKYILKHPRKVFTHLFQFRQTIWLLLILLALNITEAVIFIAMDWNRTIFTNLTEGDKVLNGYFTAISTRTAGFNTVDLSIASPAVLIIQIGFMYISSYPVALSVRYSKVDRSKRRKKRNKQKDRRNNNKTDLYKARFSSEIKDTPVDRYSTVIRRTVSDSTLISHQQAPQNMESKTQQDYELNNNNNEFKRDFTGTVKPNPKLVKAASSLVSRDILWLFAIWVVIGIIEGK